MGLEVREPSKIVLRAHDEQLGLSRLGLCDVMAALEEGQRPCHAERVGDGGECAQLLGTRSRGYTSRASDRPSYAHGDVSRSTTWPLTSGMSSSTDPPMMDP